MLAVHLLCHTALSVAVVDRGTLPGRGLAYGSPHRFHLLNVPAGEMSAWPDVPDDFLRWARTHYDACAQFGACVGLHREPASPPMERTRLVPNPLKTLPAKLIQSRFQQAAQVIAVNGPWRKTAQLAGI